MASDQSNAQRRHEAAARTISSEGIDGLAARQSEANAALVRLLQRVEEGHPTFTLSTKGVDLGASSIKLHVKIDGPRDWRAACGSKKVLAKRIADALQAKYGGQVSVEVFQGSITLVVVLTAIEALKITYEVLKSTHTIVEYVVRCAEASRWDWPPIESMFTLIDAFKRTFLGL